MNCNVVQFHEEEEEKTIQLLFMSIGLIKRIRNMMLNYI